MATSQIEKDLNRLAHDRLWKWVNDTRAVFDMADLGDECAAACIITELVGATLSIMRRTGLEADDLMELFQKSREAMAQQRR